MNWKDKIKNQKDYVLNIASEAEKATMLIHGSIGGDVDGFRFAEQMSMLSDMGIKEIDIRINTVGGSVVHGYSIFSAMQDERLLINTVNDGICASMGSHLLMAGSGKRMSRDYGAVMVHDINGIDEEDENGKAAAKAFRNSLKIMYKAKTKMTDEEIEEIFSGGRDIWLTAEEAFKKGFIDEIIKTGKTVEMKDPDPDQLFKIASKFIKEEKPVNAVKLGQVIEAAVQAFMFKQEDQVDRETVINQLAFNAEIDESTLETIIDGTFICPTDFVLMRISDMLGIDYNMLAAAGNMDGCSYNMVSIEVVEEDPEMEKEEEEEENDGIIIQNKIENKMENIKNYFNEKGMKIENESEFIQAFTEIEEAKNELTNQVESLQEELKEAKQDKAQVLVDGAANEGKIQEVAKEKWVQMAVANYDLAKSTIDSISTPAQKITEEIKSVIESDEKSKWTIRDWEKKDPKGLKRIKDEAPEQYEQMYNAHYKK